MSSTAATVDPGARRALWLATAGFVVTLYGWSLLGPLAPDLQERLGLSELELSVMVSVPVLLGSLMRIPLGALSDRYGGRIVFTALMAFTPLPLVGLALFHDSLGVVLAFGFLLGFAGASFAVGVPLVSGWWPAGRHGLALGIYGVGMGGTVLSGLTAPTIAGTWGLSAPFWIAAILNAAMAILFYLLARNPPGHGRGHRHASLLAPFAVFKTSTRAWGLTLFYFLAFGGFVAMFLYLPKLLTSVHELTKTDAGARAAGFALLAVIGRPLGGWLADRLGAERVLQGSFLATAGFALVLAVGYGALPTLTVGALGAAVTLGIGTGAVLKLITVWFPDRVGAVTGVVGAAGGLGGFFPPLLMGVVFSVTGSYFLGFVLMAAVAAVCMVVLRSLTKPPATRAASSALEVRG